MDSLNYRAGIDVGSTTAKLILIDENGNTLFSAYSRHHAEPIFTMKSILQDAIKTIGNAQINVLVTGSAGMGIAEKYKLPFIQEVVASAEVIHQRYPQVSTLIDIGGEDAKMIFFGANTQTDMRMNGSCAGGTGAFIDEMATLLNVSVSELDELASRHSKIYPMASRCGVFAKTDLQNLLSRQVPKEDIAASVFHAVVLQTLATLSRGKDVTPAVLFSGGPFTFLTSLKKAFLEVLQLSPDQVVNAQFSELLPALGAALAVHTQRKDISLRQLLEVFSNDHSPGEAFKNRHVALFASTQDYEDWQKAHQQHAIPRVPVTEDIQEQYFLGIDSGSTTTKVVLIDSAGRLAFSHYASNAGNSLQAVQLGLDKLRQISLEKGFIPNIVRSAVTGYGEDLVKTAFGFDEGIVETLAHYRAAQAFDPDVSFILDIGGQDMKAIFVNDGRIENIEINEACSSGCGSFIESFARNMGYSAPEFAELACAAQAPYDLGTRCTVFMNSRVKQALREGAHINDISAGLAYSVILNALHKVLKITDMSVLGDHILVQGGTFRNAAVHKALEQLTGKKVVCPDIAELMGAYGAALTTRDSFTKGDVGSSAFIGIENTQAPMQFTRRDFHCSGCENKCVVTRLKFPNGGKFFSGNRCENIFSNYPKNQRKGFNMPAWKNQLLFNRPTSPAGAPALTIGIPRVLNMFENYPFWNALLVECGFQVRLSAPSSNKLYQTGAGQIMSENLCFPGKLVSGHILNLVTEGVDRIFYPMVFYEKKEFTDADNTFNCPVVSGYPDVIRSTINPQEKYQIPLDMPAVSFQDDRLLYKSCLSYLKSLGIKPAIIKKAFRKAKAAQDHYKQMLIEKGAEIIHAAEQEQRLLIMLMGRPYHADPMINHNIPELLVDFGVDVITEDSLPMNGESLSNTHVMTQWEYINRYFYAARWVGQQPNIELVQLNSFGCGPDPFILSEVQSILAEYGKRPTVIRIDEIESSGSTRLRLRSMLEMLRRSSDAHPRAAIPRKTTKTFQEEDRIRTLIVPDFSPFCSPPIVRPFIESGYQIVQLPPPNRASVDTGLKYTNNEICYPGIITLGDLVKTLQSGQYDLSTTAIGFSQTGGQCRATSYPSMIKKALVSAGFEQVPVITLSTSLSNLNAQPGFKFNRGSYLYKAALSMLFTDALSDMHFSTIIREISPGNTQDVTDYYLNSYMDGSIPLTKTGLLSWLKRAVNDFNAIRVHQENFPRVGIVGEIYVKYNAFSNNHVAQWLMDQNLEVVMPSFLEFFQGGMLTADQAVQSNVRKRDAYWMLNRVGELISNRIQAQFEAVLLGFARYRPRHAIRDVANHAQEILSLNHQYGESWLIAGEIASFVKDGITNVLCLQPFGCIANHVIAKGVQKRLQQVYPNLNLLFLDADAGVSEVNFFNRMHFFIDQAKNAMDVPPQRA
jgi:predicted CoA-substrate-specific enzyme activase